MWCILTVSRCHIKKIEIIKSSKWMVKGNDLRLYTKHPFGLIDNEAKYWKRKENKMGTLIKNDMIYKERCEPYELARGKFNGYEFYIVSFGTHPCCYIDLGKDKELYKILHNCQILDVHGGITYDNTYLAVPAKKGLYIGWDYMHYGDYNYNSHIQNGTQYSIYELISDCHNAIEEITMIKESLENSWNINLSEAKIHLSKLRDICESETEKTLYGGVLIKYIRELFEIY